MKCNCWVAVFNPIYQIEAIINKEVLITFLNSNLERCISTSLRRNINPEVSRRSMRVFSVTISPPPVCNHLALCKKEVSHPVLSIHERSPFAIATLNLLYLSQIIEKFIGKSILQLLHFLHPCIHLLRTIYLLKWARELILNDLSLENRIYSNSQLVDEHFGQNRHQNSI